MHVPMSPMGRLLEGLNAQPEPSSWNRSVFAARGGTARPWGAMLALVFLGLSACGPTSSTEAEAPRTQRVKILGDPIVLKASREYKKGTSWQDGEISLEAPLPITLPVEIPVREGNAGNHRLELWYREPSGLTVNCDYRGGSDEPHPESNYQRALGRRYVFERCSNGALAGQTVQASWIKLHVRVGDQKDPAGRTRVELRLGGTPVLPPPVSPAESVRLRDSFSWQNTQPLAERTPERLPALYYVWIYLEDRAQVEALDTLRVHHDSLPLFGEELARWSGQQGFFLNDGDGKGIFRFALMPGITYNLLRQAALEGHAVFRAIVLRPIPEQLRGADGSLSYAALHDAGFRYLHQDPPALSGARGPGTARQQLLGPILNQIIHVIAEAVEGVVIEVQHGIGVVDRYARGSKHVTVKLDVANTDPSFQEGTPMLRTWGVGAGSVIRLPGVRISARQILDWRYEIPTLFYADTDAEGIAQLELSAEALTTMWCVAVENPAAEVTELITEIEHCAFPSNAFNDGEYVELSLQHAYFNVLAQSTDARQYLQEVGGLAEPLQAHILVGPLTAVFGENNTFAPCLGLPNLLPHFVIDTVLRPACVVASAGNPLNLATCEGLISVYSSADIILGERITANENQDVIKESRLVPTHEYGHFAFCSMLYRSDPAKFMTLYSSAMLSRMDPDPEPTDEAAFINEGFADFLASQLTGGTNYFQSPGDTNLWSNNVQHCVDQSICAPPPRNGLPPCLERNTGRDSKQWKDPYYDITFDDKVARVAATLHDLFDSWQPSGGKPTANEPGNGNPWKVLKCPSLPFSPPVLYFNDAAAGPGPQDESVRLDGQKLFALVQGLEGPFLSEAGFMSAMDKLTRYEGYSWCERCRLFAASEPTEAHPLDPYTTPQSCTRQPISSWIGPRPAGEDVPCGFGRIQGQVILPGKPVEGTLIRIKQAGVLQRELRASAQGTFSHVLPPGLYELEAELVLNGVTYRAAAAASLRDGVNTWVELRLLSDSSHGRHVVVEGTVLVINDELIGEDIVTEMPVHLDRVLTLDTPESYALLRKCDRGDEVRFTAWIHLELLRAPLSGVRFSSTYTLSDGSSCENATEGDRVSASVTIPHDGTAGQAVSLTSREFLLVNSASVNLSMSNEPVP